MNRTALRSGPYDETPCSLITTIFKGHRDDWPGSQVCVSSLLSRNLGNLSLQPEKHPSKLAYFELEPLESSGGVIEYGLKLSPVFLNTSLFQHSKNLANHF